jgi:phosphoribosylaminoimidazole-succinocarboxamide synthase
MSGITQTNFNFPGQKKVYHGKVRDVYFINNYVVMIASDRISAFDHILPKPIPFKGQVLNQIAAKFLESTKDIIQNWVIEVVDPNVTIGHACDAIPIEMVVRNFLVGHAWREYKSGKRKLCGVSLPDGLKENDKLPKPIITPATKAEEGHDEDISREDIIAQGLVPEKLYNEMEKVTFQLFERGTEMANSQGLILVDTKYEFGLNNGKLMLIDEIHTPDSSRYFYFENYQSNQEKGLPQKHLSKEFVREWLISNNFQGLEGQTMPDFPENVVESISERYIELYEQITGMPFKKVIDNHPLKRIENNIRKYVLDQTVV